VSNYQILKIYGGQAILADYYKDIPKDNYLTTKAKGYQKSNLSKSSLQGHI